MRPPIKKESEVTKMARPKDTPNKPEIDKETFESLMEIHASREEVMRFYGYKSKSPLIAWIKANYDGRTFEEVRDHFEVMSKVSLRRKAFELAEKNATVLIFLLKTVCGMSDNAPPAPETDPQNDPTKKLISAINAASRALSKTDTSSLIAGIPKREDSTPQEPDTDL